MQSISNPAAFRVAGSTCHDRFCVPCANARSRTIAQNVVAHLDKRKARFLTLTTPRGTEGLQDALDHLYQCFAKLRKTAFWKRHVTGGVAFCEIKYKKKALRWNVHLHSMLAGSFLPQKTLSRLWHKITGDSYIVDIRSCQSSEAITRYVTKYASKPMNPTFANDDDRLDEAVVALTGRRLATTFGTWRSLLLTDTMDEDDWEQIGTLVDYLSRAAAKDEDALYVIRRLDATAAQATLTAFEFPERSPPTPKPTPTKYEQATMFGGTAWYL